MRAIGTVPEKLLPPVRKLARLLRLSTAKVPDSRAPKNHNRVRRESNPITDGTVPVKPIEAPWKVKLVSELSKPTLVDKVPTIGNVAFALIRNDVTVVSPAQSRTNRAPALGHNPLSGTRGHAAGAQPTPSKSELTASLSVALIAQRTTETNKKKRTNDRTQPITEIDMNRRI
jgi:hypothetical protein